MAAAASADLMMSIDANLKPPTTTNEPPQPSADPQTIASLSHTTLPTNNNNTNNNKNKSSSPTSTKLPNPNNNASSSVEMLNPFVHKLELVTSAEKVQVSIPRRER